MRRTLLRVSGAAELPGEVVGVGIEDAPAVPAVDARRRLTCWATTSVRAASSARGCAALFDQFLRYVREFAPSSRPLVGRPCCPSPCVNVRHLGVISDAEKLGVISAARLVHSPFESLSMALLEAWKMGARRW
jgi:hypothetical protein